MIETSVQRLQSRHVLSEYTRTTRPLRLTTYWWRYSAALLFVSACLLPFRANAEICYNSSTESRLPPPCTPSQREAVIQGTATIAASTMQLRALQQVTSALGEGRDYRDITNSESSRVSSFALQLASLSFAGTSDSEMDVAFGRWNTFTNLKYSFGDHDRTFNTPAYDVDTTSFLAGADYRLNPDLVIGFALGYLKNDNDFSSGQGQMELKGYSLSGFGSWYVLPAWYIDGIVRMGWNEYDIRRHLASGGTATGDTEGTDLSLSIGSGYEFNIGALSIGPRIRFRYTKASIDGYVEHGEDDLLAYGDQDIESLTANLGVEATYAVNTDFGVILPQFNLEWVHEFKDDPSPISSVIRASATNEERHFLIPVDRRDDSFFRGSLGATAILPGGKIMYLLYETTFSRDNRDRHAITAGVRIEL